MDDESSPWLQEIVERVLTCLPSQSERIRATRVSKAWLDARKEYPGPLWRRLVRIRVRTILLVDRIDFDYSDGTTEGFGDPGGKERPPFELDGDLVRVEVRQSPLQLFGGDIIDAVRFVTLDVTHPWSIMIDQNPDFFSDFDRS